MQSVLENEARLLGMSGDELRELLEAGARDIEEGRVTPFRDAFCEIFSRIDIYEEQLRLHAI